MMLPLVNQPPRPPRLEPERLLEGRGALGLLLFCCAGLVDPRLGLGALVLFSLAENSTVGVGKMI